MLWSLSHPVRATHRAAVGFALCASLLVSALPASAAVGGHLYLQVGPAIERFPLQNGIPSAQPDLTIPNYGGALAVAPDGTVYAMQLNPTGGFHGYTVYAFAPGQTKPSRKIVFPKNGMCTLSGPPVQGLAVDAQGNLFVLVVYAQSGARRYLGVAHRDVFPICLGVAVLAPDASGKAKPLQTIALNDFYFGGMAVSSRDALYVNLADNSQTLEIADAVQHPHQTRTLPANDDPAAATDLRGNVYLLNYSSPGAMVNVFAPSWTSGPPTRSISLSVPFNETIGLAVRGRLAYLATFGSGGAVGVFDATGNGPENPLAVVNYGNVKGPIAIGP
jgi:hypothetical protein